MEFIIIVLAALFTGMLVWMNFLATIAVKFDYTLSSLQKITQTIFVWVLPFFGAGMVLHLMHGHYPEAIKSYWIPWPFKKMILGRREKQNPYRDENDSDVYLGKRYSGRDSGGADESD